MTERETREVIVERDSRGGTGAIALLIVGILAVALLVWVFFNMGAGDQQLVPDEINIDVTTDTAG